MVVRTETEIKSALENDDPISVVREVYFGDECWLFEQRGIKSIDASYAKLKNAVAGSLDINPKEVTLIGSAKVGFSTAPGKVYRPFRKGRSDIDLAIISPKLFNSVWESLSGAALQGYTQYADQHARQIFLKYVILESKTVYKTDYLSELSKRLLGLNKAVNDNVKIKHDSNYRIYASVEDAERYHVQGIIDFRKGLARGNGK